MTKDDAPDWIPVDRSASFHDFTATSESHLHALGVQFQAGVRRIDHPYSVDVVDTFGSGNPGLVFASSGRPSCATAL